MYTLSVENQKGEILNLFNNKAYDLLKVDGLAPPVANLNFSELSNFDGSVYNSAQLGNRNIVLTIKIHNPAEENRNNLYKYFSMKKIIRVIYENDLRKVYCDGYVETFECDLFVINEIAQISIICPDPYWKEEQLTEISFSNTVGLFEFPFDIPEEGIEFSTIEGMSNKYINNSEIETGTIIEFRAIADVDKPKFINRTTQKYFSIDFNMIEGDVIRINSNRGKKSVILIRNAVETNIINNMVQGSTWINLAPGLNELSYECERGQINLIVYMATYRCYEGV